MGIIDMDVCHHLSSPTKVLESKINSCYQAKNKRLQGRAENKTKTKKRTNL